MVTRQEERRQQFEDEIPRIVEAIKKYKPRKVILFGSWVRGDFHHGSDIDLVIIKETSERFIDRIGNVLKLCDSKFNIEPLVYTLLK